MVKNDSLSRVSLKRITPDVSGAMGALHQAAVTAAQDAKVEPDILELVRIRASQHDGHVPDEVYAEAAEVFDEIAALIWAATVINGYNRIAIATRMVPGAHQPARK
jgi:alkylhydroperoxidase family enzyme